MGDIEVGAVDAGAGIGGGAGGADPDRRVVFADYHEPADTQTPTHSRGGSRIVGMVNQNKQGMDMVTEGDIVDQ